MDDRRSELEHITLRRALVGDAAALARFAARSFEETYGPVNDPDDIKAYILKSFGPAVQAVEISDSASTIFLAIENGDHAGELAGYTHLVAHDDGGIELKRLYIDQQWKGRGLAGTIMAAIHAECRRLDALRLWLTVWERNHRAIAYYQKCGFQIVGQETFLLGEDLQADHVMELRPPWP